MHTLNDISCIKTDLVEGLRYELMMKGLTGVGTCEAGQIVDMIKDLAQAEKDCMEKCYYESVVGAMEDYDFDDEHDIEEAGRMGYRPSSNRGSSNGNSNRNSRMGYDTRRYSNGRYAPKGKGHYSPVHGYTPSHTAQSNSRTPMTNDNSRMGYYPNEPYMNDEYGQAYRDYKQSLHYYHETGDEHEKMNKEHHAEKHIQDTVETVKDIWEDASPELKKKIKGDMSKLLAEMAI